MKPATDRQMECLREIRAFMAEHGLPPTLRELGARLGIHSTNCVSAHIDALERKGLLRVNRIGRARALVPADGDEPVSATVDEQSKALRRRVLQLERTLKERDAQIAELRSVAVDLERRLADADHQGETP